MRLAIAALVVGALAGCAVLQEAPRPGPQEGAWPAERARHTREGKLYDGLAMRAFASATYESPTVRAARVERIAEWKAMTPTERAALLAAEEAEAAQFDDFTLSFLTGDRTENDLDVARTTWRVALVAPGVADRLPLGIVGVRIDAQLRALYPNVGDFDVVYRVRFRRIEGAPLGSGPFTLRLAGARGQIDLAF